MRRIILFNMITLDGFFEGPGSDISWHNVDAEFNDFAIRQLHEAEGLLFGRKTYQLMASYWPTPEGLHDDPVVAGLMNSLPKYVFSNSLTEAPWSHTTLLQGDAPRAAARLKAEPGGNLFVFGSASLASALTRAHLIDEYRILVNPLLLGEGTPLFSGSQGTLKLRLLSNKVFRNGNVLLCYHPDTENR